MGTGRGMTTADSGSIIVGPLAPTSSTPGHSSVGIGLPRVEMSYNVATALRGPDLPLKALKWVFTAPLRDGVDHALAMIRHMPLEPCDIDDAIAEIRRLAAMVRLLRNKGLIEIAWLLVNAFRHWANHVVAAVYECRCDNIAQIVDDVLTYCISVLQNAATGNLVGYRGGTLRHLLQKLAAAESEKHYEELGRPGG